MTTYATIVLFVELACFAILGIVVWRLLEPVREARRRRNPWIR